MFGRNKYDDYDEYNEKASSKYDDDYVAPSDEYREECRHDHEQSYSNINTVNDCTHTHGQTYADADSEQRPYDNYISLESRIEPFLMPGEHLLWVGGDKKSLSENEKSFRNVKRLFILLGILCILCAFLSLTFLFLGIIFFVLANVFSGAGKEAEGIHAITDRRVISILKHKNITVSVPLQNIINVTPLSNFGCIAFFTLYPLYKGQSCIDDKYRHTMGGVDNPDRVSRLLIDTMQKAIIQMQGSNINGKNFKQ